jgi:tRNA G18 (ribose-2'-O)-methylase SpoU
MPQKSVSTHVLLSGLEGERPAPRGRVSTIVAWDVRNPGNLGAIIRLAANFGCARVLFVDPHNTEHNLRRIKKAAVDGPNYVDWSFVTPEEIQAHLAASPPIIGLETSHESVDFRDVHWPSACTVMIGGEKLGLPDEAIELCERTVHIPTCGPLHSLNVSHALAIALFGAACEQREDRP